MVPLRRLGSSSLMVSPIGLGCWQFSQGQGFGGGYWSILSDDEIRDIIRASLQGGTNWFDTAESYGGGRSEQVLARALKTLGKTSGDVVIATKWMPVFRTAGSILKTIEKRTDNLAGFRIDLYQIHHPYSFSSIQAQMRAMARLVERQKIRFIGVSNFSAERMRTTQRALADFGLPLVSNQVRYSLLDRRIETNGVLAAARELGITIIAYSPLAQGILSGKFHRDPELIRTRSGPRKWMPAFRRRGLAKSRPVVAALEEIAAAHDATASQAALSWLLQANQGEVVVIPGATSVAQAEENARAARVALRDDERARLEQLSRPFR